MTKDETIAQLRQLIKVYEDEQQSIALKEAEIEGLRAALDEALALLKQLMPCPRPWETEGDEAKLRIFTNLAREALRPAEETIAAQQGKNHPTPHGGSAGETAPVEDEADEWENWDRNEKVGYYSLEEAIRLARLWKAGKMIGGDENQVIFVLLRELDRLSKEQK